VSPYGSDRTLRHKLRRGVPRALALGLVLVTATACSAEDTRKILGMPKPVVEGGPVTEQGLRVFTLWQGAWIAAMLTGLVVWGLIVWSVMFHRRSRHGQEIPPQVRYNVPIEALYTVLPFIIIAVLFYFTARDENEVLKLSKNPANTINVVGRQWSWSFNYNYQDPDRAKQAWDAGTQGQPPTLVLPKGQSVRFVLTSPDVIHSFWVPAFLFKMDIIPGRVNEFELTPTRTGTFVGKCAELCGVDHSRMLFNAKVVEPDEYLRHLDSLRAKGQSGSLPSGIVEKSGSEK
jgi:cytochrome c oxidase subunit 2